MEEAGYPVIWENIGDPVHKGFTMPLWMKEIISEAIHQPETFAYCDSKGVPSVRTFLADKTNQLGGAQIDAGDITFFNGLGDAITTLYRLFSPDMKVIQPSPTYPAHTSAERQRLHHEPVTYTCDLQNGGRMNVEEIRRKATADPAIRAVLVINPDNPSGTVHSRESLQALVDVAREFDLLIIADEIYEHVVYEGTMTRLSEVIGTDVKGIAMKGISKEFPWPGARCGWIEVYNRTLDDGFDAYCRRVDKVKMSEVCSTTLPQMVIPKVMMDHRYPGLLAVRNACYRRRMERVREVFAADGELNGEANEEVYGKANGETIGKSVSVSLGGGGFYAVLMPEGLDHRSFARVSMREGARRFFDRWTDVTTCIQTKLADYLLAEAGVCVVPLSAFQSDQTGFRITLLETSDEVFDDMLVRLKGALEKLMHVMHVNDVVSDNAPWGTSAP